MIPVPAQVIAISDKIQKALGEDAARELVDLINQVAVTSSSVKVDKTEYDAHAALIGERFERFGAEMKSIVGRALLTGLAWVTVLVFGLFGALSATLK